MANRHNCIFCKIIRGDIPSATIYEKPTRPSRFLTFIRSTTATFWSCPRSIMPT